MKDKGLYIVVSSYAVTRWLADYYDSDTIYYIMDGVIIGIIGLFLYLHSKKDLACKMLLSLILILSLSQIFSETHAYCYNSYINLLPEFIFAVTAFEVYNNWGFLKSKLSSLVNLWRRGL